jgi:hypothetical protein
LASLELLTPDGKPVKAFVPGAVRVSDAEGYQVWHIDLDALEKSGIGVYGTWHVAGKAGDGLKGIERAEVDLMVIGEGGVRFDAEAYFLPKHQNTVQLLARAMAGQKMIKQMRVAALWQPPVGAPSRKGSKIVLYDDGKHGDKEANDGIFGNRFGLRTQGNHAFRFVAVGTGERAFRRETVQYVTTQGKGKPEKNFWQRLRDRIIFWN